VMAPGPGLPQLGRSQRLHCRGPVLCRETSHGHRALDHHRWSQDDREP
jgi:hypothetical protein